MTRYAAVDCGTNSIRLLVSDYAQGEFTDVYRGMKIVRLGEGVDATGAFSPAAIQRTREALEEFVLVMKAQHVRHVRMVATSATRDAANREEFLAMTAELLGQIEPGVRAMEISGEEEARLSFAGAISDLPADQGPVCVIDLGGGSTEFIVGKRDGSVLGVHSAKLGCVRLTERFLHDDPPTPEQVSDARAYTVERLREVVADVPIQEATAFVGVAGTFTTLSALAQGLEEYEAAQIHGSELRFDASRVLTQHLMMESSAIRAAHPVIHPGRADVIGGGAIAVEEIMQMIETETGLTSMIISEKDILDGIVAKLAARS